MSKTPKYIMDFISVLAPGNEELYLSFFKERIAIIDATKTIERLEAENERLKELCNDLINAALNDCVEGRQWDEVEERALEAVKGGE